MEEVALLKMSRAELYELCKQKGVVGVSNKKKEVMIEQLLALSSTTQATTKKIKPVLTRETKPAVEESKPVLAFQPPLPTCPPPPPLPPSNSSVGACNKFIPPTPSDETASEASNGCVKIPSTWTHSSLLKQLFGSSFLPHFYTPHYMLLRGMYALAPDLIVSTGSIHTSPSDPNPHITLSFTPPPECHWRPTYHLYMYPFGPNTWKFSGLTIKDKKTGQVEIVASFNSTELAKISTVPTIHSAHTRVPAWRSEE